MEPDRVWLLTPAGRGAIAVVRMRGSGVPAFLGKFFSKPCAIGRCVHSQLKDEAGQIIDDPVIVLSNERVADINLHGGGAVVRAALALAERSGFDLTPPALDETTSLDPVEQEMHVALSLAATKLGLSVLLSQPPLWRNTNWTAALARKTLADRSLWYLLHPPTVALVGSANVGKSTLANALFGQARSIVLDLPGTTRDFISDLADLDGLPIHLIDTPGQRQTIDAIEQKAIASSQRPIEQSDLKVLVVDPTQPQAPQLPLMERYSDALRVTNKTDCPATWEPANSLRTCARSGLGIAELIAAIRRRFLSDDMLDHPLCWTLRQRDALAMLCTS